MCKPQAKVVGVMEENKKMKQLKIFEEIGAKLKKGFSLKDFLLSALLIAQEGFGFYHGAVLLEEDGKLRIAAAIGYPKEIVKTLLVDIEKGEGITGTVAKERRTIVVKNVSKDKRYIPAVVGTKSEIATPIIASNSLLGVLNFESPELDAFDKADVKSIETIASLIGAAILNHKLYREVKEKLEKLSLLYRLGREFSKTIDLSDLLPLITSLIKENLHFDYVSILLKNKDGYLRAKQTSNGYPEELKKNFKVSIEKGEGITGSAAKSGETIILNNVKEDERYIEVTPGIKSEIAVPLKIKGKVIGVINVESSIKDKFTEESKKVLEIIASETAIAIENALLYEQMKKAALIDELTGLANYRSFRTRLDSEVERALRYKRVFSLVMFDIDFFKDYNDNNGHDAGNVALRKVGEILLRNRRNSDMAARFGGEEFIIILPETDRRGACAYAERIRKEVEETKFPGEEKQPNGRLTVSGGVAEFPADGSTAKDIIKAVDMATYIAKNSGRNKVICGKST